jgi:glycosyltransferase 2 family protein
MTAFLNSGAIRPAVRVAVGLAITILFVWLIAKRVDLGAMRSAFSKLNIGIAASGLLALAAGYAVRIWRWHRMLVSLSAPTTYLDSARAFMSGMAINSVLPLRAGDAARVVGLSRETGFPMARILSTMVVERLLDMGVLLLLLFLMLLWLPAGVVPGWILRSAELLMGLVLVLEACVLAGPRPAMRLVERFIAPWSPKLAGVAHHTMDAFVNLARPALVAELLAYSVVSWMLEGLLFVAFVAAGGGARPLAAGITTFALGTLSTLIPSGPGYVGTFDMFSMIALQIFGMDTNTAAAIAVAIHATLWLAVTGVGACFLIFGGFALRRRTGADVGQAK